MPLTGDSPLVLHPPPGATLTLLSIERLRTPLANPIAYLGTKCGMNENGEFGRIVKEEDGTIFKDLTPDCPS